MEMQEMRKRNVRKGNGLSDKKAKKDGHEYDYGDKVKLGNKKEVKVNCTISDPTEKHLYT